MDQALEQNYNKPAKGQSGIIGITREKEAVMLHDLIKHEKTQIVRVVRDLCGLIYEDEYCLHHEFSESVSSKDEQCVIRMIDFIQNQGNPFERNTGHACHNIISKKSWFYYEQSSLELKRKERNWQACTSNFRERTICW